MSTLSFLKEKKPRNYSMFSFSMPFVVLNTFLIALKAILYKLRKDKLTKTLFENCSMQLSYERCYKAKCPEETNTTFLKMWQTIR